MISVWKAAPATAALFHFSTPSPDAGLWAWYSDLISDSGVTVASSRFRQHLERKRGWAERVSRAGRRRREFKTQPRPWNPRSSNAPRYKFVAAFVVNDSSACQPRAPGSGRLSAWADARLAALPARGGDPWGGTRADPESEGAPRTSATSSAGLGRSVPSGGEWRGLPCQAWGLGARVVSFLPRCELRALCREAPGDEGESELSSNRRPPRAGGPSPNQRRGVWVGKKQFELVCRTPQKFHSDLTQLYRVQARNLQKWDAAK